MQITNLPPLNMIAGHPFAQMWQLRNTDETPADLTAAFATCSFSRDRELLLSVPLTIDAESNIELSLTAGQVDALAGPRVTYEVTITTQPGSPPAEVWRGATNVQ